MRNWLDKIHQDYILKKYESILTEEHSESQKR